MCRVIAVANQKGGVGKTTTCVNLGIGLARAGKKVLLVEADAQGSMAVSLGVAEPDELDVTLVNIMEKVINDEDAELGEGIIHHEEGIDFIPANIELAGLGNISGKCYEQGNDTAPVSQQRKRGV